ncbi:MAG: chorismate mutase [Clostridia bacterium]
MEQEIKHLRQQIDAVNDELLALFLRRMALCKTIGICKRAHGLPILDVVREEQMLTRLDENSIPEIRPYVRRWFETMLILSREYQAECLYACNAQEKYPLCKEKDH